MGVTVSETQNPRKVLPKAVNELIMRILIFYVGALVAIMAIVPWRNFHQNADGSFGSPFIMVFKYAGLDWAAALVFFVVITAAASALNSLIYSLDAICTSSRRIPNRPPCSVSAKCRTARFRRRRLSCPAA